MGNTPVAPPCNLFYIVVFLSLFSSSGWQANAPRVFSLCINLKYWCVCVYTCWRFNLPLRVVQIPTEV